MNKNAQLTGTRQGRPKSRDLNRTRARILAAARNEFVARGFAGARTRAIARRAGVNQWMLCYCFGSKKNLYREILRARLAERTRAMESGPHGFAARLVHLFTSTARDPDGVRLLQWEALTARKGELLAAEERRTVVRQAKTRLEGLRQRGLLPPEVDLEQLWISLLALAIFPLAFPQLVRLATGLYPTDARFQARRVAFLTWLAERLLPAASVTTSSGVHDEPQHVTPQRAVRKTPCRATSR
jgi:TetR/AcrR family transcriptional regulator